MESFKWILFSCHLLRLASPRPFESICTDSPLVDILAHAISESSKLPTGVEIISAKDGSGYRFHPESRLLHVPSSQVFTKCRYFPQEFSLVFTLKFASMRNDNQYLLTLLAVDRKTDLFSVKVQRESIIVTSQTNGQKSSVRFTERQLIDDQWHNVMLSVTATEIKLNLDCKRESKRVLKRNFPAKLDTLGSGFYIASKRMKRHRFTGIIKQIKMVVGTDASIPLCSNHSTHNYPTWVNQIHPYADKYYSYKSGVYFDNDFRLPVTCGVENKGMLMYKEKNKHIEVCKGTAWERLQLGTPRLNYVEEYGEIQTHSNTMEVEVFTVQDEVYMAAANQGKGRDTYSSIYKWNDGEFDYYQNITTDNAQDWEYFSIDHEHFLAVANQAKDERFPNSISVIYRFDTRKRKFVAHQYIKTFVAQAWESFHVNEKHFLVVINYGSRNEDSQDTSFVEKSWIYMWDADERLFIPYQSLDTVGGASVKYFELVGRHYLAVANSFNGKTSKVDSVIYQWKLSQFVPLQYIETTGAHDFEYFSIKDRHFLAVANYYHFRKKSYSVNSTIFEMNIEKNKLEILQNIQTNGALDFEYFDVGEDSYLIVASSTDGEDEIQNIIYKWQGVEKFVPVHVIATKSCGDWEMIRPSNGESYLLCGNIAGRRSKIFHINV